MGCEMVGESRTHFNGKCMWAIDESVLVGSVGVSRMWKDQGK